MDDIAIRYVIEYYQEHIQGIEIKKDREVIHFPLDAIYNLLKDIDNTQFVILNLVNDLKKSKRISDIKNTNNKRPDISHFQIYKGNLGEHWVAVSSTDNKLSYYTTLNTPDDVREIKKDWKYKLLKYLSKDIWPGHSIEEVFDIIGIFFLGISLLCFIYYFLSSKLELF